MEIILDYYEVRPAYIVKIKKLVTRLKNLILQIKEHNQTDVINGCFVICMY